MANDPPKCGRCGCDSQHKHPFKRWQIGDTEYDTCPRWLVTAASTFWLKQYRHYLNGLLPVAGGFLEQPHPFIEAMDLIGAENGRD